MIEVHNLTKQYGSFQAVKDVSFAVETGGVLGFLGPNGAGKTTIMKILTGYHFPTSGTALIDGVSVQDDPVAVKKRIGYLPESVPLYGELSVTEYLSFIADSRLLPKAQRYSTINETATACGLSHMLGRRIETLSKGYKQRVGLAQAIIHDPPILILDEPTAGLDPNQIIEIRSLIKELGKRKTIILSTHILQEVEAVCTQVMIINEGRIAAQGTPEEIALSIKGGNTWELTLKGAALAALMDKLDVLLAQLSIDANATILKEQSDGSVKLNLTFPISHSNEGELLFDWAVAQGLKILSMRQRKLSVEDIFVKLTGDAESQKEGAA
ncbi:ABC transporter ATP-binding protein [Breznakiellaceae bacterium SP9]